MKLVGIILDESKVERLGKLSQERAISSIPVASCYRAIDFSISNMTNSDVKKIAVITQYSSSSLIHHLSTPKVWNLGEKQGGLYVYTPTMIKDNLYWHRGTIDSMYQNIVFLKKAQEPYVVISAGNLIYKLDYRKMLDYHIEKNSDLTILSKSLPKEELKHLGVMKLDKENKLLEFEEKPLDPQTNNGSLGVYIMKRTLLIKLLEEVIAEGRYDFVTDIISRYRKQLNIYAYDFNGYWSNIGTLKKYFDTNMDFLKQEVRKELLFTPPYISTRIKDDPPAKFNKGARMINSLAGGGNIINGTVIDSVLFNKVYTGNDSVVENSIVMNDTYIGNNCKIKYAIIDKSVVISDGKNVIGTPNDFYVVPKGTII